MNVSLFYTNLKTLNELLASTELDGKYSTLISLASNYRTNPDETTNKALQDGITDIQDSLTTINVGLSRVPHSDLMIKELHASHLVEEYDVNKFVRDDLFTAHERLQTKLTDLQNFKNVASSLVMGFGDLKYDYGDLLNENLFSIEFAGETDVDTLNLLSDYAKKVRLMLYNYACVSEDAAESVPVIHSISKNSPLTLDISWAVDNLPKVLSLIGMTVLFYLNCQKQTLKVTELEQIMVKQVPSDEIPEEMLKGFDKMRDNILNEKAVQKHVDTLLQAAEEAPKTPKISTPNARTKGEQKNYLAKGVEQLIDLLKEGAKVEVYKADELKEGDSEANAKETQTVLIYTRYKQIEKTSRALGAGLNLKIPKKAKVQDSPDDPEEEQVVSP